MQLWDAEQIFSRFNELQVESTQTVTQQGLLQDRSGMIGGGVSGAAAGVTCAGGGGSTVHIHPQAAPVVCRHVLDTLIQLAKVIRPVFTHIWDIVECIAVTYYSLSSV